MGVQRQRQAVVSVPAAVARRSAARDAVLYTRKHDVNRIARTDEINK